MTREVEAAEVESIKVEYSNDAMWGNNGPDGYNVGASYVKFNELVTVRLHEVYPNAEIEMTNGINDTYAVDYDRDPEITEPVANIVGEIWQDGEWLVEA